jgi:hypothetical protein
MTQAVAGVVSPWPGAGHLTSSVRPQAQPRSGTPGDRADLERRLLGGLAIAERAAALLCGDGWSDPGDPDVAVTAEKAAAETALLLLVADRVSAGRPLISAAIHRIASRLLPPVTRLGARAAICTDPAMLLDHAFGAICLACLGHTDDGFVRLLHVALRQPTRPRRERLPHRALEQLWLLRLAGHEDAGHRGQLGELVRQSALGSGLDVMTQRRDDLYALTHSIMYATNLGADRALLPRAASLISDELDAALAVSLDRQDYDLAGELLACYFMLGFELSPSASFAFDVINAVEDEAGFLPAPTLRLDRLAALHGVDRSRYLLAASYHTIYVMALLCSLALQETGTLPPERPAGCPPPAALLARFQGTQSRHWEKSFAECPESQQSALTPLLITVALNRAMARRNLGEVSELLSLTAPSHAAIPAVTQATEILRRAAAASLT